MGGEAKRRRKWGLVLSSSKSLTPHRASLPGHLEPVLAKKVSTTFLSRGGVSGCRSSTEAHRAVGTRSSVTPLMQRVSSSFSLSASMFGIHCSHRSLLVSPDLGTRPSRAPLQSSSRLRHASGTTAALKSRRRSRAPALTPRYLRRRYECRRTHTHSPTHPLTQSLDATSCIATIAAHI